MRVAVVHHWFVTRGGGERVAECIAALFPEAEIFTLVASPAGLPVTLEQRKLHTSFLQRMPLARTHHRHYLPLYPAATRQLDVRGFDLVLSSDSGPIKGVQLSPGATHICYCHSPMRYLWDGYTTYRESMRGLTRLAFSATAKHVRKWDARAAADVSYFLANSQYVADRILRCYGRTADVLPPPIDLHRATKVAANSPGEHYLCAGRLVGYKRTEILIEACQRANRRLRIAGTGPEEPRLRKIGAGDERIEFLGELSTDDLWSEYSRCRALLFAADEDFGMVPLEAQACGRPVIAYGSGGSLETVRGVWDISQADSQTTGLYFGEQTAGAIVNAMERWESIEGRFHPQAAKDWASHFATTLFLERYLAYVLSKVPEAANACVPVSEAAAVVLR
ncbi:MAG TPA: glycosyltransferase [Candidatus Aquilonibacter sp.]|nr:glycosyltransferase [Candidatus Aquilonibacter sp.]